MRGLFDLFRPSLRHVAAAFFAAGILHLCIALAAPHLSDSLAYRQFTEDLPLHKFESLAPVTPESQKLPFMGPDARYAACRFDATGGVVAVEVQLPAPGWVLSIFTPAGENIYSAVAQPSRALSVSLRLLPSDDRAADLSQEARGLAGREDGSLAVVAEQGLLLLRAPDQGTAYRARNLAGLARASCSYTARARD
jgi:uncharacterized membrane protein